MHLAVTEPDSTPASEKFWAVDPFTNPLSHPVCLTTFPWSMEGRTIPHTHRFSSLFQHRNQNCMTLVTLIGGLEKMTGVKMSKVGGWGSKTFSIPSPHPSQLPTYTNMDFSSANSSAQNSWRERVFSGCVWESIA